MSIEEGFYDGHQIRTTDQETGEECWFHWTEINEHLVLVTKIEIVGGDNDGDTCRKQLWFDGDFDEKGGETKAWEAMAALGYTGRNLEELEGLSCWGGGVRLAIYEDKNGYSNVGWIGTGGGGSSVKIQGIDKGAKARFAAMVRARAGSGPPKPTAKTPAPSTQPWDSEIPF